MKKTVSTIGWKYTVYGILHLGGSILFALFARRFFPDLLKNNPATASFLETILVTYVIGFPLVFLLTFRMPKLEIEKKKLGFKNFMLAILLMAGLIGLGIIIGIGPDTVLKKLGHNENSDLASLLLNSNGLLRTFTVGICAPVFEELIFRKLLVDHLAPKGRFLAILTSGIVFGLFHGNFGQCFFAMFIGWLFACIYVETGNILYSIGLHMLVNMTTSVVTVNIEKLMFNALNKVGLTLESMSTLSQDELIQMMSEPDMIMVFVMELVFLCWCGVLFTIFLAGVIAWILMLGMKKVHLPKSEDEEALGKQAKALFTSWGFYLFAGYALVLFAYHYWPS